MVVKHLELFHYINCKICCYSVARNVACFILYKGRLRSSWTHLITQSWNFVEVL